MLIASNTDFPPSISVFPFLNKKMAITDWDTICFNAAAFVAALFLLEFGADKFIDHTAIVARRLGVSQTLVALLTAGAEWEEVSSFFPFRPGQSESHAGLT